LNYVNLRMQRFISGTFFDGTRLHSNRKVFVFNAHGILTDVLSESELDPLKIEMASGLLTPGFINAHLHLELSHLKGCIPQHTGLSEFALQVVKQRTLLNPEQRLEAMRQADLQMMEHGIVAAGDISNTQESISVKQSSKLTYHTFIECIGLLPQQADKVFKTACDLEWAFKTAGLQSSLAAHAPYSCSQKLLNLIIQHNALHLKPLSIHVLESDEEQNFLNGIPGTFNRLYQELGISIQEYTPPKISLNEWLFNPNKTSVPMILVHNVFANNAWYKGLSDARVFWAFCPNANRYIQNRMPEVLPETRWITATDSLASNSSLNLLSEVNLLYTQFNPPLEALLSSITSTPAQALQLETRFGYLKPGTACGLNEIEITPSGLIFIKKWIH